MDSQTLIIAICVIVAVIVVVGAFLVVRNNRRTTALKAKFGPEYARTVDASGGRRQAEAGLVERQRRVEHFAIHPLPAAEKDRYVQSWRRIQAQFVDDPAVAVAEADGLIGEVMAARGYPVAEFDQRAADISVDHPVVVENYRNAHAIAVRHASGDASTEDLRQAMVHYRALFDELVEEKDASATPAAAADSVADDANAKAAKQRQSQ